MDLIPRITHLLSELAARDNTYEGAFDAAMMLQRNLVHAGILSRHLVDGPNEHRMNKLTQRPTIEILQVCDNLLSACQERLVGKNRGADVYASVSRIRQLLKCPDRDLEAF